MSKFFIQAKSVIHRRENIIWKRIGQVQETSEEAHETCHDGFKPKCTLVGAFHTNKHGCIVVQWLSLLVAYNISVC